MTAHDVHVPVAPCERGGGIFPESEKLAGVRARVTGGGGVGTYRHAGPRRSETLDIMVTKYPNWFSPHLHAFRGQREKLPFDEHWFLAACAPRPFLALEGDADVTKSAEFGPPKLISQIGPRACFGEMAILDDGPRSAHVIAMEESNLLILRRDDFYARIRAMPEVAIFPRIRSSSARSDSSFLRCRSLARSERALPRFSSSAPDISRGGPR